MSKYDLAEYDHYLIVERDERTGELQRVITPLLSDFHNHFRQGPLMTAITPAVISAYRYMLAMPNTVPPILTVEEAETYEADIKDAMDAAGVRRQPELVMTLYLANSTIPELVRQMAALERPMAVKSYPPGGTTNSDAAAPLLEKLDVLAEMERLGVRLLIHGECTHDREGNLLPHPEREAYFMQHVFPEVRRRFPKLRICLEHISTTEGVEAVKSDPSGNTVCTITPQHAYCNDSAFAEPYGGVNARCMPYLKAERHRRAVAAFMTSGDPRVILGTDCAPHIWSAKDKSFAEAACGCYTPHAAAMYLAIFEAAGAVDERFVKFACFNGPDWWGLPRPEHSDVVVFKRVTEGAIPPPTPVPELDEVVVPFGWTIDPEDQLPLEYAKQH